MPELPDVTVYVEALASRVVGRTFERARVKSPFLVRSVDPPLAAAFGTVARTVERIGKRIVVGLDDDLFLVIHLMIAGRLHWKAAGAAIPGKIGLAAFDFDSGTLTLTEASQKKRASLHVVRGRAALAEQDRGGLEPLATTKEAFVAALARENRTLKRALTDPSTFSGIGNAYSDEILFHARLSPVLLTSRLTDEQATRLFDATRATLADWIDRLRKDAGGNFPEKVTAFRPDMAVHGRFGQPCRVCRAKVQRIVRAENESNYCANCQTGGKLLADRALSRLFRGDWPKTLEEWESE